MDDDDELPCDACREVHLAARLVNVLGRYLCGECAHEHRQRTDAAWARLVREVAAEQARALPLSTDGYGRAS
jgi:hypothetical protein